MVLTKWNVVLNYQRIEEAGRIWKQTDWKNVKLKLDA